ncbi:hypothetical protein H5410_004142 [Solanum commersonii]|uniref:Uncharacterized protein n=1 Tax=Solanum commersonii TaxID=4109 RepID=A0A9J6B6X8_SOLCO|nr:hypothetical protein H5410_004142 [Solanum commersonii]
MKPLVNGKEIMNILQIKSGGPVVREWQQNCWSGSTPSSVSAEECLDWMKQVQSKRARTSSFEFQSYTASSVEMLQRTFCFVFKKSFNFAELASMVILAGTIILRLYDIAIHV